METEKEPSPHRQWFPWIASVLVQHALLAFVIAIAPGYFSLWAFGYRDLPELMMSPGGLGVLGLGVISAIVVKPASDLFYGAGLVAEARTEMEKLVRKVTPLSIPDPSLFYRTMTSDIGTLRKCAGYVYAVAHPGILFALGAMLGAVGRQM